MLASDHRRQRSGRTSRSRSRSARASSKDDSRFVCLRGMPFEASTRDVSAFLRGVILRDGLRSIRFVRNKRGGVTGDCYVECQSKREVERALARNRQYMGRRYIEIYKCSRAEAEDAIYYASLHNSMPRKLPRCQQRGGDAVSSSSSSSSSRSSSNASRSSSKSRTSRRSVGSKPSSSLENCVVYLRGLPYECAKAEIVRFFSGLQIAKNGIAILREANGRCTGEAYVQFASPRLMPQALARHRDYIGDRYIEVFRSTVSKAQRAIDERVQINANAMQRARSSSRHRSPTPIVCLSPPSSPESRPSHSPRSHRSPSRAGGAKAPRSPSVTPNYKTPILEPQQLPFDLD